jgi:DNA-binding transcriptional LysR family regulator
MDLENVRVFVKLAELGNFTRTGEQLGIGKSRVSTRLAALEHALGTMLVQRTTRAVRLTPDGEQFFTRARFLIQEADALYGMFQATSSLSGRVRVDLPIAIACNFVIPRLPEFLAQHPSLDLLVSTTDKRVDVIRDGFDCVLRIGTLVDSGLVARRVGTLQMINCASPTYTRKYGIPRNLDDLDKHLVVHYSPTLGGDGAGFEYPSAGEWSTKAMRSAVTVNNTDAYRAACVAGLGIMQAPRIGLESLIKTGRLIEVLPDFTCAPMPVSLVHSRSRGMPKRVRVVMQFIAHAIQPAFAVSDTSAAANEANKLDA